MYRFFLSVLVGLTLFTSCKNINKQVDQGAFEGRLYTNEELGWTMEVPKGWKVSSLEEREELEAKGKNAIEKTIETEMDIDLDQLKHLVAFQKGQFDVFQSTTEPFTIEYEGEWEETEALLKELLYYTYLDTGMQVDTTETTVEWVDGLDFSTYSFALSDEKGKLFISQIVYTRLMNDSLSFGVNLSFTNDRNRDEMLKAWRGSKFEK